eukprot:323840-Amphidinium_carterae.2
MFPFKVPTLCISNKQNMYALAGLNVADPIFVPGKDWDPTYQAAQVCLGLRMLLGKWRMLKKNENQYWTVV